MITAINYNVSCVCLWVWVGVMCVLCVFVRACALTCVPVIYISAGYQVMSLIKVANPAKNIHIDHVLESACRPVIDNECPHSETHASDKL